MKPGDNATPVNDGKGPPRPFLSRIAGISTLLDWSGRIISATSLAIMFVALLVNVILRYAFGSGIAWAYEIHSVLLPWLVSGGIVIAAAQGRNISITLLPDLLPPAGRRAMLLAVNVVILAIALSVLQSSPPILKASTFQTLSTLGIKQVWGYSSLIYAFAAMAIIATVNIVLVLRGEVDFESNPEHASLS
ncbi:TRAP transporter small permease [Tropicimonas sp. IMCC34043]|uniref:TRAP transporter small permease n=1 Tax=Tropicimonas sp. IMCC34043 TaxID=2248760 RepID=UPI000E266D00|nr:TRAP transporter small permease [Tropicimonas sp. IMCC34043]